MKNFLFIFILINCLFFFMSCKQTGDTNKVASKIYDETPTITATCTTTPTVTPIP